jgi:diguanylate cyclase (GGDEF)-like protein
VATDTLQERRDAVAREYRDRLGAWLDMHPAALGRIPREPIEALAILVDTARYATAAAQALGEENLDLREVALRLGELAWHDALTGLPNRRALEERLATECDRAHRYFRPLAVMIVDVDNLKQVNDRHGHQAGDILLQVVAQRVHSVLRSGDLLGRLAGDEFLIICPETHSAAAEMVADKLISGVAADPIDNGDGSFSASISVGWANLDGVDSAAEVLRAADKALYEAKARGRGCAAGGDSPTN